MRVLLSCDGGEALGVGHVMRSLSLAEAAVEAGHTVLIAGHFHGPFLQAQLVAAPVEVAHSAAWMAEADPAPLIEVARGFGPDVIHVDSYLASDRLREEVSSAGVQAVVSNMEDGTFGRRPADVVVDPTIGAELSARPDDATTWLLRGSRYCPVRRRVIQARQARSPDHGGRVAGVGGSEQSKQVARSVLVVMGGTDPVGLVRGAVELLALTGLALEVTVIAAGENADRARTAAEGSRLSLNVLAPVDDLAAMMSANDMVISAAGTSVWELCCIGVPSAVAWAVDNQHQGYDRVVEAGAAIGLGGPELGRPGRSLDLLRRALTDPVLRAQLAGAARRVVDGLGAWRITRTWEQASALRSLPAISSAGLLARPATPRDCRQLWHWRNDPATRAGSRSWAEVPWDDHLRWFTTSLARTDRMLLVVKGPAGLLGTVRWDLRGEREWEVSITMAPERRGHNLARSVLRAGEEALSELTTGAGGTVVKAYLAAVHIDNQSSRRLFETSAYVPDLPPDPEGFMRLRKDAPVA